MTEQLKITSERVDDIPLLIGLMKRIRLPEIIDRNVGTHGNQKGLSNGWLITIWLAYIISEQDHRKSHVREWAWNRNQMLSRLIGQPIREVDFSDDRLENVLTRLADPEKWHSIEQEMWQNTVFVYKPEVRGVRLDSTSSYGYHQPEEGGLMQFGQSKDHRPDLPQLKLMAAVAEPSGHLIASDVHPGQRADDPLYLPVIERVRRILDTTGVLYTGDCKMASINIRGELSRNGDYYLVPLPCTGENKATFEQWISACVDGQQPAELIWNENSVSAMGYEFERCQETVLKNGNHVKWNERVLVVRSSAMARREREQLECRLAKAEEELVKMTPQPGRGKRQYKEEESLRKGIEAILHRHVVNGLLDVVWHREEKETTRHIGRGRSGENRPKRTEVNVRYQITSVHRNRAAIKATQDRQGWRIFGCTMPADLLPLDQAVLHYNKGWCVERDFHLLKDKPLGISPFYVYRDDQLHGMTHLLTLGLRALTLLETRVRRELQKNALSLAGLYDGQPNRTTKRPTTKRPTAKRLLRAFVKAEVTLYHADIGSHIHRQITPLSDLLKHILYLVGLPESIYTGLADNSG